ncbi:hypothetical protein Daus18300_000519 [Diaporthe australafricana]|uniref:Uncharacterized protein n=1 Tax=Diaporthe australafricana TaxID=127596 RepID=A0ABR3Y4N7_9PEZI
MQFSVLLVSMVASSTFAAPVAYLQMGREPTGKLAVKSIVRPDDILERDTLSTLRRGHFDAVQAI